MSPGYIKGILLLILSVLWFYNGYAPRDLFNYMFRPSSEALPNVQDGCLIYLAKLRNIMTPSRPPSINAIPVSTSLGSTGDGGTLPNVRQGRQLIKSDCVR